MIIESDSLDTNTKKSYQVTLLCTIVWNITEVNTQNWIMHFDYEKVLGHVLKLVLVILVRSTKY